MNPLSRLKNATPPVLLGLLLACLPLAPIGQAVSPPPDGAYPHFTTAEGQTLFRISPLALQTAGLAL
jgi:hypothetical protein